MSKKVVILTTSADEFQGHASGAWMEEVTGPFYTFTGKGCEVTIASIKGGKVPAVRCDVKTLDGCGEKEKAYVEKQKAKGADAIASLEKGLLRAEGAVRIDAVRGVAERLFDSSLLENATEAASAAITVATGSTNATASAVTVATVFLSLIHI